MKGWKILLIILCLALAYYSFLLALNKGTVNDGVPEIFRNRSDFTAAVNQAKQNNRMVVIDMTASWCPPCREMDRNVWVDETLTTWLNNYTIPVQIDVDNDEITSRKFNIEAIPAIIAYDPDRGVELGRHIGYIEAPELLAWLNLMQQQKTFTTQQPQTNTNTSVNQNNKKNN